MNRIPLRIVLDPIALPPDTVPFRHLHGELVIPAAAVREYAEHVRRATSALIALQALPPSRLDISALLSLPPEADPG